MTTSTWFVNQYIFKSPEVTSLPSKLERLFLLDSGASICVLHPTTFTILADHFLNCSKSTPTNNDFKTLQLPIKLKYPYYLMYFSHSIPPFREVLALLHSICSCKFQS